MKQMLLVFLALLSVFFASWGVKAKTPVGRPANLQDTESDTPWYEGSYTSPIADSKWKIEDADDVPDDYIPVPGQSELYMVVKDGKIVGYKKRAKQADGSWAWTDVNPDIPEGYEPVEGVRNVYKVTAADGTVSYVRYIRNADDDTYCFVPCTKDGTPLDIGTSAEEIDSRHYVKEKNNTYRYYTDDGVFAGWRERVKDKDGQYVWASGSAPEDSIQTNSGFGSGGTPSVSLKGGLSVSGGNGTTSGSALSTPSGDGTAAGNGTTDEGVWTNGKIVSVSPDSAGNPYAEESSTTTPDGTYVKTHVKTYTETKDGVRITYKIEIVETYDANGNLVSTEQNGPYEVGRTQTTAAETPNQSLIQNDLDAEVARVNANVSFDTSKAQSLLAALNAARTSTGAGTLTMDTGGSIYKLALLKAADMATYDYASETSPMYGDLDALAARYGVSAGTITDCVIKTSTKDATGLTNRFLSDENARRTMTNDSLTQVGIAVVERDGMDFVAEIFAG